MSPLLALLPLLMAAPDPVGQYLGDLEQAGVVKTRDATLDGLRQGLVAAEQDLVTGNVQTATTNLFGLVESGAFAKFTKGSSRGVTDTTRRSLAEKAVMYFASQ